LTTDGGEKRGILHAERGGRGKKKLFSVVIDAQGGVGGVSHGGLVPRNEFPGWGAS